MPNTLPANTVPAPLPAFRLPALNPFARTTPTRATPDFDWTTLDPPLAARPPTKRHPAARTAWGAPDPLDPHLLPARPWAPMTDEEWAAIAPYLWASGCGLRGGPGAPEGGRPMADPRRRLDAIFRGCTQKWQGPNGAYRAPWHALPADLGKPDTVSRTHRRWAHAHLWRRLLVAVFDPFAPPAVRGMAHWVCCVYRRAIRALGLTAITFARRLGLHSALPAPPHWLPNEDLHAPWQRLVEGLLGALAAGRDWRPPPGIGGPADLPLVWERVRGRRPLPRWAEPA